jgi:membrane carboxypeptidase/penicillin-binding protein PbpC
LGLKKIPDVAGKTGTAYDFTDALFAGYDSNFICAVWAGFDKPQKIYRAAFGRELALPVWVEIMNASAEHHPPREIKRPPDLKEVEICSRSGLLATDKCYDSVKSGTGDLVQRRTTYMELATAEQMPTELCNVHGEPRAQLARELPASEFPRAEAAIDLNEVKPVIVKAPTLLAEKDPYNSAKATVKPVPTPEPTPEKEVAEKKIESGATTEDGKPVLKAIPVQRQEEKPAREERPLEIRKAIPVGPLEEESEDTLLKSATPPPTDSRD